MNALAKIIITAVLMVVVVGTVVVPIVSDVQTGQVVNGSGSLPLTYEEVATDHTLAWDPTSSLYTIDGETVDVGLYSSFLFTCETFYLSTNSSGRPIIATDTPSFNNELAATALTITISGGTATIEYGSESISKAVGWAYVYDPEGEYVTANLNMNQIYFTDQDELYATGAALGSVPYFFVVRNGQLDLTGGSGGDTGVIIQSTEVYDGVYRMDGNSIGAIDNYSFWIVERTITYEIDGPVNTLVSVIPLLIAIGIIVLVSAAVIRSRD